MLGTKHELNSVFYDQIDKNEFAKNCSKQF